MYCLKTFGVFSVSVAQLVNYNICTTKFLLCYCFVVPNSYFVFVLSYHLFQGIKGCLLNLPMEYSSQNLIQFQRNRD